METPTLFKKGEGLDTEIGKVLEEIAQTVTGGKYAVVVCTIRTVFVEHDTYERAVYLIWDREFGPHVCGGLLLPFGMKEPVRAINMAVELLRIRERLSSPEPMPVDVIWRDIKRDLS